MVKDWTLRTVQHLARRRIHADAVVEIDRQCPAGDKRKHLAGRLASLKASRAVLASRQDSRTDCLDKLRDAARHLLDKVGNRKPDGMGYRRVDVDEAHKLTEALASADIYAQNAEKLDELFFEIQRIDAELSRRAFSVVIPHDGERLVSIAADSLDDLARRIELGDFKS